MPVDTMSAVDIAKHQEAWLAWERANPDGKQLVDRLKAWADEQEARFQVIRDHSDVAQLTEYGGLAQPHILQTVADCEATLLSVIRWAIVPASGLDWNDWLDSRKD